MIQILVINNKMGNTDPSIKNLHINIQLQRPFYNSGSSVQGVIFLQAKQNIKTDALYVRIEGQQWCQWFQGTSKNRVKNTGNDKFYQVQYQIYRFKDGRLSQGKHAWPFSIQLSQNIPGSFSATRQDAKIQYKMVVYAVNFSAQHKKHLLQIPLMIRQPFRQQLASFQGESTRNPSTYGCCKQGQVSLKAKFDRNVCFQGQKIEIYMQVDNTQGGTQIDQLLVKLVQYTFVSANNSISRTYKNTIYKHKVGNQIQKGELKRLGHKLPIPTITHQSAISTLVALYYRIQITTSLGMFSSDNPSIYSPLFILKKQLPSKQINPDVQRRMGAYKCHKPIAFRAGQYWFRKNRNLSVMNFKATDLMNRQEQFFIQ